VLGVATCYAAIHWGSTVGGGADSYGYVSQAGLWLQGRLSIQQDIVRASPWPLAAETWAPLGYRPDPREADRIVPLYPPGLPIAMAMSQRIGGYCAAFLVVPICGFLTVLLTYALGRRWVAGSAVALAAAALVATSPIFLYQLMNPMTDVPVTAMWTLAVFLAVRGEPLASGLAAGAAILIRPNVAPVALAIAAWLIATRGRVWRFAIGVAPAVVAVAAVNRVLYGSPWTSGYGTAGDLYAIAHWRRNLSQFAGWIADTQTPIVVVAALYFAIPWIVRDVRIPRPRLLAGGFIAATLASYLFYFPFDAWWYLRFLLPMWPIFMLLLAAAIDAIVCRFVPRAALAVFAIVVLALAVNGLRVARNRYAFDVGRAERRYVDVARFIIGHTDPEAVILSAQHSGTLRLYAGRLTLRYDQLDAAWLDRVVEYLRANGRRPYFVLEGAEISAFTDRFGALNELGRLTWRPMARFSDPEIAIYDAVDRRSTDEPLAIAAAASRRAGWRCDPPYVWPTPLRMK